MASEKDRGVGRVLLSFRGACIFLVAVGSVPLGQTMQATALPLSQLRTSRCSVERRMGFGFVKLAVQTPGRCGACRFDRYSKFVRRLPH